MCMLGFDGVDYISFDKGCKNKLFEDNPSVTYGATSLCTREACLRLLPGGSSRRSRVRESACRFGK